MRAAIAWAFGSLATQMKDKSSAEYSKINLSKTYLLIEETVQ